MYLEDPLGICLKVYALNIRTNMALAFNVVCLVMHLLPSNSIQRKTSSCTKCVFDDFAEFSLKFV